MGNTDVACALVTDRLAVSTKGDTDIVDITGGLQQLVTEHGFDEGHALVFVPGSTASLTTVEYEPGLLQDLPLMFERLAPRDQRYFHHDTWNDGNGHSHCRASLMGSSIQVPFERGKLCNGTWQQIVLLDFDNRPRQRDLVVQLFGQRG